jgi:hypothetical protein
MFLGHWKKTLEWFVPKYMSAESVSESEIFLWIRIRIRKKSFRIHNTDRFPDKKIPDSRTKSLQIPGQRDYLQIPGRKVYLYLWNKYRYSVARRALGDVEFKPFVSAVPDVTTVQLTDRQAFGSWQDNTVPAVSYTKFMNYLLVFD